MDYKYKCLLFTLLINSLFFAAPNEGKHGCWNILHITSHSPSSQRKGAAAAAKSLQLCATLCDPIDGSPKGSPIPGILQARTLEWGASAFSQRKASPSQFQFQNVWGRTGIGHAWVSWSSQDQSFWPGVKSEAILCYSERFTYINSSYNLWRYTLILTLI